MKHTFPEALTSLPQWVCWRLEPDKNGGKPRKVPYNPKTGARASSTNPASWALFNEAQAAVAKYGFTGLGFVFTKEGGIVGIDIDHCRDPKTGTLNETATAITARFADTYAEISPSGTGIHLFVYGDMPEKGNKNATTGVEMYGGSRYFTMTGKPLNGAPDKIMRDEVALKWVHSSYIKPPKKDKAKKKAASAGVPVKLSDEDVLEKAKGAKNAESFLALWEGKWQETYGSQSEADHALCCSLAFWTGKDAEQMDRLFRLSKLFRLKWDVVHHGSGATYGAETIARAIEVTEYVYSLDRDVLIFEKDGRYYRVKGDNVYPITNFVFHPVEMILAEDESQLTIELVTTAAEKQRLVFMTADFGNLQRFKNVLNKRTIALSFTGNDADLELLKIHVSQMEWIRKQGVKVLGLHRLEDKWAFVTVDGAIQAGGAMIDDVLQLDRHSVIDSRLHKYQPIDRDALLALGPLLLRYNEPAKTVAVLAWCAGCFIKEHLRACIVKYPHLYLIGEAGSGKSNTLERVILPMFARSKVVAATQVTPFTLMKESASSNIIPQALDEFKPSKIERFRLNALYNHMRDSYDGHEGMRGRSDQSSVSYALLAPFIAAGEESPDEAALRERGIELLFSKRDLKDGKAREAFHQIAVQEASVTSFGRALLDEALGTEHKVVGAWHDAARTLFNSELPPRIVNNLACCMAGLSLIKKLCDRHDARWEDVFEIPMDACARYLQFAAQEFTLDGGDSNKSIVEQTLEIIDRMGLDDEECRMLDDGTKVAIHFKTVYDRYTKYRRDHAILGECLSYAQFMRQLRKSDLYSDARSMRFSSEVRWATILHYSLLRERCDVEGFRHITTTPLEGTQKD